MLATLYKVLSANTVFMVQHWELYHKAPSFFVFLLLFHHSWSFAPVITFLMFFYFYFFMSWMQVFKAQRTDWKQKSQISNRSQTDTVLRSSRRKMECERNILDRWRLMGCRRLRNTRRTHSVKGYTQVGLMCGLFLGEKCVNTCISIHTYHTAWNWWRFCLVKRPE